MTMRRVGVALTVPLALVAFAGCSSDDSTSTDDGGSSSGEVSESGITIAGEWARESPAMADAGAIYMTITAAEDDVLVGASVPTDVAETTEIHETSMADMEGDDSMDDMDMESTDDSMDDMDMEDTDDSMDGMGEMTMTPVDEIALPAGEAVALEPGGYHVMLLGLAAPLEEGQEIELTLTFEKAGEMTISVPVLTEAPAA